MSGRRLRGAEWAPFLALAVALAAALFWPYLTFRKLYLFTDIGSDTVNAFYPRLVYLADHLRAWGLPRWSFQHGMGASVFGRDVGDPSNLLLAALGRDRLGYGIGWVEAAKVVLGGAVFFAYLGRLGLGRFARTVGGLCFAFSGFMIVGSGWYVFSTVAIYLALALYAFERGFTEGKWGLLPVAFCLIALGRPFALYTHGVFLGVYGLARWIGAERPLGRLPVLWGRLGGLALLGAAMGAVLLVNQLAIMAQSPRAAGEASYAAALKAQGLFHPGPALEYASTVARLFGNDLFGTGSAYVGYDNYLGSALLYVGLPALLLCPLAFGLLSRRERWGYGGMLGLWALVLALPGLRHAFWLYIGDYYRAVGLFAGLAVLVPALIALDRIDRGARPNLLVLGAALAAWGAVLYGLPAPPGAPLQGVPRLTAGGFILAYALLLGSAWRWGPSRWLRGAFLVLLAAELWITAYPAVDARPVVRATEVAKGFLYGGDAAAAAALVERTDPGFYRVNKTFSSGPSDEPSFDDALVLGYRGTASYDNFNQGNFIRFLGAVGALDPANEIHTRWAPGLGSRPLLETLCGVKYRIAPADADAPPFVAAAYAPRARVGSLSVLENTWFLPLGLAFAHYVDAADLGRMEPGVLDLVLLHAVAVDDPAEAEGHGLTRLLPDKPLSLRGAIAEREAEAMTVTAHTPDRIAGTVAVGGPRLLFLCIPFDSGWHARVDGKPAVLERVDAGLTGLYLTEGRHTVELAYRVPRLGPAVATTAVAWGVWGVLFLRRKRP